MPRRSESELSTDPQVRTAKAPVGGSDRAEYRIKGTPGLVLRVTPSGSKSWGYWLKDPSTNRWRMRTLGPYPTVTLERAKQESKRLDLAIFDGENPFKNHPHRTLADLADEYMKRHALPKKRSADQDQRKLNADVLPELGAQLAVEVCKSDIVSLLDKIVDRGAPIGANRTLALLRKLYNWAIAEGYLASNPASGIPMRAKEASRARVLSDNEIVWFWNALDGPGFDPITADVLRFQLLVGARIREVTDLERAELDLDSAIPIWVLPKRRAKAGRDIVRPLPPLALLIVKRQQGNGKFVFTSPANSKRPITPRAPARAVQRAAERGLVPPGFTPHDLRRTAATKLAALGVEEAVTKRILGHAPVRSDVLASVYNRHSYVAEMRTALVMLEQHLVALTSKSRESHLTRVAAE